MAKNDIAAGMRFGRLTVEEKMSLPGFGSRWRCKCDCGAEKWLDPANLRSGNSQSCGCLAKERRTTHGLTKSRVYVIWKSMHQRCGNPKANGYENYGGRGIKICERWQSFDNFLEDMGHPPPKYTLEREDNNGNYERGNCRWATYKDQLNNRRTNVMIEAFGKRQSLTLWAEEYQMAVTTLKNRIFRGGMSPEQALSMPVQKGYKFSPTTFASADEPQASRWRNRSA